ncbi:MAG: acyl-CoA dehydrogenase family protein [Motiliproteus sp.]
MNPEVIPISSHSAYSNQAWIEQAQILAKLFDERAARYDSNGDFVAENYQLLKAHRFFSMPVAEQFGGGGADYQTLCTVVRTIGRHCGSTALAYAMHAHPLVANLFKALRGDEKGRATVEKVAANELIIAGTGANDWLQSSGTATPVKGGFRINAHKHFVSGGPGADVFVTSAVIHADERSAEDGSAAPDQVMHFSVPFSAPGIRIADNWRALGMRGTGSNDVLMENVFVPEEAVVVKRPVGQWHPMWDVILPIALPIVVSCYVGVAEAALEQALHAASGKDFLAAEVGQLKNELTVAQLALDDMIARNDNLQFTPSIDNTDAILSRKTIATTAVKNSVEYAASIVGGPGFFQGHPMERIIRDSRAIHFHPLPEKRQQIFSGRRAMGLESLV